MSFDRISQMENRLHHVQKTLALVEAAIEDYRAIQEDIAALDAYLGSPEWYADREDDAAGRLPNDLKRGVLSKDAVWNLLEQNRELHATIGTATQKENG